jgi:hypothetical protein
VTELAQLIDVHDAYTVRCIRNDAQLQCCISITFPSSYIGFWISILFLSRVLFISGQ